MGQVVETANGALRRVPVGPLYALGFVPAAFYLYLALTGRLGADPVSELERSLGLIALQLLIAALLVTPLRDLLGLNLLRFRRWLGLMAFYYALLHVLAWATLDRQLDWLRIGEDLVKRPFVVVGFASTLLLAPLALTSTDRAVRALGAARWRNLHRLAYPATALAALHFVWLVKAWPAEPLLYAAAVVALLGYRALRRPILDAMRRKTSARASAGE